MEIKLKSMFEGFQRVPKLSPHYSSPNVPLIIDSKVQGLPTLLVLAVQIHAGIQELAAFLHMTLSDTKVYELQLLFLHFSITRKPT